MVVAGVVRVASEAGSSAFEYAEGETLATVWPGEWSNYSYSLAEPSWLIWITTAVTSYVTMMHNGMESISPQFFCL